MPYEVLLIEEDAATADSSILPYLTVEQGFRCVRSYWEAHFHHNLVRPDFSAIVPVALQNTGPLLQFFDFVSEHCVEVPIVAVLPQHSCGDLLGRAAMIANDFVIAPVKEGELCCRLRRILGEEEQQHAITEKLKEELGLAQFIGDDLAFAHILATIPNVAASSAPVLLTGETGTGKELCAQAIHSLSDRHAGPFIPLECGAIPESLVESELFGHVRGSFTDAHSDQKGVVALAEGGTLFLDEVDCLSLTAQAKLLRFIQEGTYRPVGAQKFSHSDLRLIAATNRDLEVCIRAGEFRSDLYFRINVLPIHLPALRERRADIPLLANYFLRSLCQSKGRLQKRFSVGALRLLRTYNWPGNIRELRNIVHRAVTFSTGVEVLPAHLKLPAASAGAEMGVNDFRHARSHAIEEFERAYVSHMLRKHDGNVTQAALDAGKDRRVFGRLMKRYGIDRRTP